MAKTSGNVSEAVRSYLAANPGAKTGEVAAAVSKQLGKDVKSNYVSMIKGKAKKLPGKRGRKPKGLGAGGMQLTSSAKPAGDHISNGIVAIRAAASLIKECGGLKNAIALLTELEGMIGVSK